MKRFQNGGEDAIYPYAHSVTKEFTKKPFNEEYWNLSIENDEPGKTRPWWKFW